MNGTPIRLFGLTVPLIPALVAVLLIATAARLFQIGADALWLDEAYSYWFSRLSWDVLWTEVPTYETHPVLYYSLLKLWRVVGDTEAELRLLSAVLNLGAFPLVVGTAWLCAPARDKGLAAFLAGLLFAGSNSQLLQSHDARPYAMMTLAMALSLFSLTRLITHADRASQSMAVLLRSDRSIAWTFAGLGIGLSLLAWSHNIGPIFCILYGLCLLIWWIARGADRALFVNLILVVVLAFVLYFPGLLNLLVQARSLGQSGFWLMPPTSEEFIFGLRMITLGSYTPSTLALPFAVLGFLAMSRSLTLGTGGRGVWGVPVFFFLLAFGPMVITAVLSYIWQPVYLFRTVQVSQVPLLIGLALAPSALGYVLSFARDGFAVALVLLVASLIYNYHSDLRNDLRVGFRAAYDAIAETADDGAPVVVTSLPSTSLPLIYYENQRGIDIDLVPVPGPYPVRGEDYTYPGGGGGEPAVRPDMIPPLDIRLTGISDIWFVSRFAGYVDPEMLIETYITATFPCLIEEVPPYAQHRRRPDATGQCPP